MDLKKVFVSKLNESSFSENGHFPGNFYRA